MWNIAIDEPGVQQNSSSDIKSKLPYLSLDGLSLLIDLPDVASNQILNEIAAHEHLEPKFEVSCASEPFCTLKES
jgi:hypothetical protein